MRPHMRARVLRVSGQNCLVEIEGEQVSCRIRGRLKEGRRSMNSPVIAGDWAELAEDSQGGYVIDRIYDRQTHFTRASSGARPLEQLVAVNIQQLIIIASARQPALRLGFIDRAIVAALSGHLAPVIVLNKVDLDPKERYRIKLDVYAQLGYPLLFTSAENGRGIEALRQLLEGTESAIVGQSGVGKSSLLNQIEPGLALRTREIMAQHDRGRHTTTAVQLYPLSGGGYVADTPGIKELHLSGIQPIELVHYFDDLAPFIDRCRFRDCTHLHEPDCGVIAAIEEGTCSQVRYESYVRIRESLSI